MMEEVIYYNNLYDLYGDLLTDKQKKYFEDYYFNNLSFSEMAENYNVSRNAVFKQLHIVTDKLEEYESKLKLLEKREKLLKVIDSINDKKLKGKLEDLI
ncbi:MAG: hypothetical protein IJG97_01195 [Bacilli bacterium]|nr:hypothetical protein [Bacilli bacterium]